MTQVITPGQATPPSVPPPGSVLPSGQGPPGQAPAARGQVNWIVAVIRSAFDGTPGTLRLVSLGVIFGCLIAGFGGAAALNVRHSALGDAKATTAHLVLLQGVRINLLRADAAITNSFLNGGLEPIDQLETYSTSINAASRDLAEAARASEADATALGAANTALARYSGLVQTARANNRQGLPVGVNYLSVAADTLKNSVLAPIEKRTAADQKSVDGALNRGQNARWWLILAVVAGLGLLVWSQFGLARVTHRFLNLPAAGATAVLIVVLVGAALAMTAAQRTATGVRDGAYADTVKLADARVGAFTAKRIEAFELIKQGPPTDADEQAWANAMASAKNLPTGAQGGLAGIEGYSAAHAAIVRKVGVDGDYLGAVKLATAPVTPAGSANAFFTDYDDATAKALQTSAQEALSGLGRNGWLLVLFGILLAGAAIAAAIVGWFGVSLRMGEYR